MLHRPIRNIALIDKKQEYCDRQVPEYWTVDWDRIAPAVISQRLSDHSRCYVPRCYVPRCYVPQNYYPGGMIQSRILPDLYPAKS